ncbi:MAG: galactose mutarotase [Clostridia bacterium]|nr:galactose mutarotase [Clostridia bacterium]
MKTVFGKLPSGEEVYIHRLASRLMSVGVITYGAAIQSLSVRDRNGKMTDVVLGFDTLEEYAADASCFGAVVGRFANRISGAAFELNGKRYALEANEAGNCLHSGKSGYHRRNWRIESASASMITLSLESPDGDGGFPGAAKVSVTYRIMGSVLYIRYRGASSSDTVMNLVNHSYFNLSGHGSGSVLDQRIRIDADSFLPTDEENIPLPGSAPVDGTPMDLRREKRIGDFAGSGFYQTEKARGFDHCYILNGKTDERYSMRSFAEARSDRTGIRMRCFTYAPAVQFYTGGFIPDRLPGKDGAAYGPHGGFCLETGGCPNSPNRPDLPSSVLRAGEKYVQNTMLVFLNDR